MQQRIKDAASAFVTWKINSYVKSKLKTHLRNQKVSVAKFFFLKKKSLAGRHIKLAYTYLIVLGSFFFVLENDSQLLNSKKKNNRRLDTEDQAEQNS